MPVGTNIVIKDGTLSLSPCIFMNRTGLTSVTIPNSVTSIGRSAFNRCSGLTSVTIGNSVTSIGSSVFYGCSGLTSVTIPNSVISIGSSAFSGCSSLTSVTIPNSVTSIGSSAFSGCSSLSSVTIGNSVTSIGSSAFSGCSGLTSVIIGNSVTSIGSSAFSNCRALKDVLLQCKVIENWFSDYTCIETIEIGNGTESIVESAFSGCTGLKSLTIGKNVTSIGYSAFANCSDLQSVTSYIETPFWIDNSVFQYSLSGSTTLYVPKSKKQVYQNTSAWNQFPTILEIDGEDTGGDIIVEGYALNGLETEALVGTKIVLPIDLTNEGEVKLCQFDLQLPAGVTVATKSNGKLDATLTTRAESHSISSQQLSNGNYRFIVSSMDNDSFTGNNGTLMEITLDISATIEAGEYTVKLLNAELSVPDGNDLKVVRPADSESKLIVKDYTPGDVNNDGSVSVTDVGCAINYILEQVPSVFVFDAADMNGDKSVSVTDVGMIINLILNEGVSGSRGMAEEKESNDYHFSPNLSLQATAEGYELQLEDKDAFIGFQFDVEVGDGATINGVQLNRAADSDHLLTYRRLDNEKWRVVCYSPTNNTFVADDDALLTISVVGNASERYFTGNAGTATLGSVAHFSDIRLTTTGLEELRPAALVGMPTGIANVEQGMKISVQGKTLCINSDRDTTLRLLTIGGSICRILHVHRGQNNFDGLHAGIYMIDNKKIIIQ